MLYLGNIVLSYLVELLLTNFLPFSIHHYIRKACATMEMKCFLFWGI